MDRPCCGRSTIGRYGLARRLPRETARSHARRRLTQAYCITFGGQWQARNQGRTLPRRREGRQENLRNVRSLCLGGDSKGPGLFSNTRQGDYPEVGGGVWEWSGLVDGISEARGQGRCQQRIRWTSSCTRHFAHRSAARCPRRRCGAAFSGTSCARGGTLPGETTLQAKICTAR